MVSNEGQDLHIYMQPVSFPGEFVETGVKDKLKYIDVSGAIQRKILKMIKSTAESFYETFKEIKPSEWRPDKAKLEFGIQVDFKGEVFIAQASANSSIKIILEWNSIS